MQQDTSEGYIQTQTVFRRGMGAHAIIAVLLLADLAGLLLDCLVGAAFGAPLWWLLRGIVSLAHASLLLDCALVLICFLLVVGSVRQSTGSTPDNAWAGPTLLIFLIVVVLILLKLLQVSWLALPATAIPAPKLGPFPWPLPLSPIGATLTALLSLLAHLVVVWCYRTSPTQDGQQVALSRAYPHGTHWTWVEECYVFYKQGLTRFQPSPIARLVTPPTFLFFSAPEAAESPETNPERDIFWSGTSLVIANWLLDDDQLKTFLPLLARMLYDAQSSVLFVDQVLLFALSGQRDVLPCMVLWLPLWVARFCERRWRALEKERVLDRDRFAYWCGEAERLRHLLRLRLREQRDLGQPDDEHPTLAERIEHLDGLLRQEAYQVQELRKALPSASSVSF